MKKITSSRPWLCDKKGSCTGLEVAVAGWENRVKSADLMSCRRHTLQIPATQSAMIAIALKGKSGEITSSGALMVGSLDQVHCRDRRYNYTDSYIGQRLD